MECQNITATNDTVTRIIPVPWDCRYVIQLLLAMVGIIGNSLVLYLYFQTRKLTMGATNRFIAALAITDLISSICIVPIPTLSYVPDTSGGNFYCKIVYPNFLLWVSIAASIFSLTVLSLERYVAVAHPLRYKRVFTVQRSRIIVFLIWLFAFIFNTFVIYVNHNENGECHVSHYGNKPFQAFIGLSVFIVEYLIPVILMLLTNIRSIQLLKERAQISARVSQQRNPDLALLEVRQRIIYMLLVVIISFIIYWTPDQFLFLAYNLGLLRPEYLYGTMYRAFVALAFANSCINPVLYTLTNKNFREAMRHHLFRHVRRSKNESEKELFTIPFDTDEMYDLKLAQSSSCNSDTKYATEMFEMLHLKS